MGAYTFLYLLFNDYNPAGFTDCQMSHRVFKSEHMARRIPITNFSCFINLK